MYHNSTTTVAALSAVLAHTLPDAIAETRLALERSRMRNEDHRDNCTRWLIEMLTAENIDLRHEVIAGHRAVVEQNDILFRVHRAAQNPDFGDACEHIIDLTGEYSDSDTEDGVGSDLG